jgi:hypothetical protein
MKALYLLVGSALLCLSAWAQDTATIVGTVTDSSGGVIPGAKVTVSNPEKGFTRELVTNTAGEYTAAKVPIGNYVVSGEKAGFQKLVRSRITLAVGQTVRTDFQLQVGQATQQVTVAGNIPHVETETAAVSDVITETQISNLELNGRNFVQLALLVPGAAPAGWLNTTSVGLNGNTGISFNGERHFYNNWEVDGGNNTDEGTNVNLSTYPSLDTIAEFRVSTSNYGAEMGKHSGATIEVATKSGTRDFHGEVFEYLRNDHLDANDWFANRQRWDGLDVQQDCNGNPAGPCNAPKTPLKWNDFGYNFGGPFYIPGHYNTDKSKTFFFWSQNWRRYRQGTVISANVPTARMRQGDFSECDPTSPNYNPVLVSSGCVLPTNPTTGQQFLGQIVPVDPNARALLNAFVPLPNNGVTGYQSAPSLPTDWRQEQIRVDQNIGQKSRVFVRSTQDAWSQTQIPGWGYNTADSVATQLSAPGKSAVLNLTHTFRPNLMNEFVVAYSVDHVTAIAAPGSTSQAGSLDKPPAWTAANLFAPNEANPLLPGFTVYGGVPFVVPPYYVAGDASNLPWYNSNPILTLKDNTVYTRGKHTLKFGFFFEDYRKNEQFGFETQGLMQFCSCSPISTGNGLADMDLGLIGAYTEGTQTVNGQPVGGYPKGHWQMTDFEPYLQDDWKVSRKLTLNLGLRYYLLSRIHDVSNPTVDSSFLPNLYDPAKQAQLDAYGNLIPGGGQTYQTYGNGLVACGTGGIPKGCSLPSYSTLAPRFGFAYDPWGTGKTVIRGGYGIYYEMGNGGESNTEGTQGNPPVSLAPTVFNVSGYQNIIPGALAPVGAVALPYQEPWGSTQQFSLGAQHEFPGNNLLGLSYVGALGRHLARSRDLDQIPIGVGYMNVPALAGIIPGCDAAGNCNVQEVLIHNEVPNTYFLPYRGYLDIAMKENTSVSSYNALQVSFRHPFGQGLTFQASYTWSHAIDDTSYNWDRSFVDDSNLSRWRATSDLNRTQMLVMNYVYALPFFNRSPNRFARNALGGWQVSGITSFFTGEPIFRAGGCAITGFGNGIGTGLRCNSLAPVRISKGVDNDPQFGPTPTWFDGNTFAQPLEPQLRADGQPGMFGYMGRNPLTGPGRNNWDMALLKNVQLPWFGGERSVLQFRWETFNTFNHLQWQGVNIFCNGNPNADGTPAFGRPCGGHEYNLGNGQVNSAWPSRIMQFGLKLMF